MPLHLKSFGLLNACLHSWKRSASMLAVGAVVALSGMGIQTAWGFAEEAGSGSYAPNVGHSTIHYELTRALARCAGFGQTKAEQIARWSTLPDISVVGGWSETLATGTVPKSTTNGTYGGRISPTGVYSTGTLPCKNSTPKVFPIVEGTSINAAGRMSGFVDLFHFPTVDQLNSLRAYAFTLGSSLTGRRFAAFGPLATGGNPMSWLCVAYWNNQTVNLGSNVPAGSLPALGVYLHARGDRGSHWDCTAHVANTTEKLKEPTHHGLAALDLCAFADHAVELTSNIPDASGLARPLFRSEATVIGNSAATQMNGGDQGSKNRYQELLGFYQDLFDYRIAFPGSFLPENYEPIDPGTSNYNSIIASGVHAFFTSMPGADPAATANRIQKAVALENACKAVVEPTPVP